MTTTSFFIEYKYNYPSMLSTDYFTRVLLKLTNEYVY